MTTTMMKLDPVALHAALSGPVTQLQAARAHHAEVGPKVDALYRGVLEAGDYRAGIRDRRNGQPCPHFNQRITDPDLAYLMREDQTAAYYAECNRLVAEHFPGTPEDYCPAAQAHTKVIEAERALVAAITPFIPALTPEAVFRVRPSLREDILAQIETLAVSSARIAWRTA